MPREAGLVTQRQSLATLSEYVTPTSLRLPPGLAWHEFEFYAKGVSLATRASLWWWGDLLNYGEAEYGDEYAQILEAADYEDQTLRDAKWVAGQFPRHLRRGDLTWSHHSAVAGREFTPDMRERLLSLAAENKWSRDRFRGHLRRLKDGAEETESQANYGTGQPQKSIVLDYPIAYHHVAQVVTENLPREEQEALLRELASELGIVVGAERIVYVETPPELPEARHWGVEVAEAIETALAAGEGHIPASYAHSAQKLAAFAHKASIEETKDQENTDAD